jgi:hypothetical protein
MAKAFRKFTQAPTVGKLIDAGKISIAGESGVKVDGRHYRPMDISDWGRPSPKDDYRREAEQRLKSGKAPPDMMHKEFAYELRIWFKAAWPERKTPAALTIERNTRDLWRRYGRGRS